LVPVQVLGGEFRVYVAKTCDLAQLFAGMEDDTFRRAGGNGSTG